MDLSKKEDMDQKWKSIAGRAVTQDNFKKKLIRDPLQVMNEFGLNLPESVRSSIDTNNKITLLLPEGSSDDLKEEVTWWQWRINIIEEFGRDVKTGIQHAAPETEEGI